MKIFDEAILKKIGGSEPKTTTPDAPDHFTYSDDVDPDSTQFPDDNDPVIPDCTAVFGKTITDKWIHADLLFSFKGSFYRKRKLLVNLKTDMVKSRAYVILIPFLIL